MTAILVMAIKVEQVEQITDGRHVAGAEDRCHHP
jgi:hypothetical protein